MHYHWLGRSKYEEYGHQVNFDIEDGNGKRREDYWCWEAVVVTLRRPNVR